MILIPDFGQVQSDDEELNLSPFELYYDEKRPFFMEGTEMFQRAEIFYSRRIGATPVAYSKVSGDLSAHEKIVQNPANTQLINATKLTGKTSKGLGIGFLNAMTSNTFAKIKNTQSNDKRNYLTQPFTNYNVFVLDQSLPNNSYISLINTNYKLADTAYMANVTGGDLKLSTTDRTYAFYAKGAYNYISVNPDSVSTGYYYDLSLAKNKGRFGFEFSNEVETNTYNPNDMGYLRANNEYGWNLELNYNILDPFWRLLRWRNEISFSHESLFKPRKFSSFEIEYSSFVTFRNHLTIGIIGETSPIKQRDYFEPRVDGRFFSWPAYQFTEFWLSSDYRKKLAMDVELILLSFQNDPAWEWAIELSPRWRINNHMLMIYEYEMERMVDEPGFVDKNARNDTIIFGRRNRNIYENTIHLSTAFTHKANLNFRLRHYWSKVNYNDFFLLNHNGSLSAFDTHAKNENINYNAFNIDMIYTWNFAPGSELSIAWKQAIYTSGQQLSANYFSNLNETLHSPQFNSFSVKVLFYLDYLYLKKNKT